MGTFQSCHFPHVVARGAPLTRTESIYFICTCEQAFILALRSCVQFIHMMKNICQVCQPCTPLITCKQLCVIRPLICQKYFKLLPQLIHMGQYLSPRQPSDLCIKLQDLMLCYHFLTRRCKYVAFYSSCLYNIYHVYNIIQHRG